MNKKIFLPAAAVLFGFATSHLQAAPCLNVTLTGTQGGPPVFQGQAGSGTLVQFGDDENNCSAINLQFDTGRGTTQQLSKAKTSVGKLNFRQSTATDLGAMAKRTGSKHLMLTHLIPPMNAKRQGPYKIPGGGVTEADYKSAVEEGGFTGNTVVGTDLTSLRLPQQ